MPTVKKWGPQRTRGLTLRQKLDFYSMPEPNSGCLLWLASHSKAMGYGHLYWDGKVQPAHRLSWLDIKGPIPKGLFALHKCDNPGCINPDHLFLGDHQANSDDKLSKGRWGGGVGQKNRHNKLTPEDVIAIRASTETSGPLKKFYGVSATVINQIKRGKLWKSIPKEQT